MHGLGRSFAVGLDPHDIHRLATLQRGAKLPGVASEIEDSPSCWRYEHLDVGTRCAVRKRLRHFVLAHPSGLLNHDAHAPSASWSFRARRCPIVSISVCPEND